MAIEPPKVKTSNLILEYRDPLFSKVRREWLSEMQTVCRIYLDCNPEKGYVHRLKATKVFVIFVTEMVKLQNLKRNSSLRRQDEFYVLQVLVEKKIFKDNIACVIRMQMVWRQILTVQ